MKKSNTAHGDPAAAYAFSSAERCTVVVQLNTTLITHSCHIQSVEIMKICQYPLGPHLSLKAMQNCFPASCEELFRNRRRISLESLSVEVSPERLSAAAPKEEVQRVCLVLSSADTPAHILSVTFKQVLKHCYSQRFLIRGRFMCLTLSQAFSLNFIFGFRLEFSVEALDSRSCGFSQQTGGDS